MRVSFLSPFRGSRYFDLLSQALPRRSMFVPFLAGPPWTLLPTSAAICATGLGARDTAPEVVIWHYTGRWCRFAPLCRYLIVRPVADRKRGRRRH